MMKVRCIKKNADEDLTVGRVYECTDFGESGLGLRVIDDEGDISYMNYDDGLPQGYLYPPELFEIVEDPDGELAKKQNRLCCKNYNTPTQQPLTTAPLPVTACLIAPQNRKKALLVLHFARYTHH
jgi:hypothetical protein